MSLEKKEKFCFDNTNFTQPYPNKHLNTKKQYTIKMSITLNNKTKVLIGPLYSYKMDKKLNDYMSKYPFVKKVVASRAPLEYQKILHKEDLTKSIFVCPSGIIKEKDILKKETKNNKFDCLIYFKNRDLKDLKFVENFLIENNFTYNILKYGSYKNFQLEELARTSKFGIILDKTETQGFAIQKLMCEGLPLFVWDWDINIYQNYKLSGTSVPYWDERCGIKFNSREEFIKEFPLFLKNVNNFYPKNFIKENLTYEIFLKNLICKFQQKDFWTS